MTATDSYLLLRALVDELARSGVEHACTSPGSRNTPIVLSLVRDGRIRCWSHVDERCAGFFALGVAKASGRPVVVTCTSGTAAANLMPAVIEAHEAGVPLIVLTADRPPELREIGAGQTIDQIKLYGDAVKWFFELGVPEATPSRLRWIRTLACRAYWTALDGRPGPVHLNIPLREPLVLDAPLPPEPGEGGRPGGRPWVVSQPQRLGRPEGDFDLMPRTLIVAGRLRHGEEAARLTRFAERFGFPLLADPPSGARRGSAAIAHYDLLLRDPAFQANRRPELILRFGDLPTSKPLRMWLAELSDVPQIAFDPERTWQDPASVLGGTFAADLDALPSAKPGPPAEPAWLARWREADEAVADAIGQSLDEDGGLSEPAVAAILGSELPASSTLFVASSMPVRDVEEFFPVREDPPRVRANRGANGIDGTVSTAFGVAAADDAPVVLLIGDVALAHDIGGLLAARRTGLAITIVLLNNDGGGIFHFLPVASQQDAFEEHIATPTGLDFGAVAELYDCGYERAADSAAFRAALGRALGGEATTIIEVQTDRAANRELHRAVEVAALDALASDSAG